MEENSKKIIEPIIKKARVAQKIMASYTQSELDEITHAVAWAVMHPERNQELSEMAVADTGLGNVTDKKTKNYRKTLGLLRDLKGKKTTGTINHIPELGITEIARPIGVVGVLVPSTNPIATPVNKIINALKCGNSVIVSPSPKGAGVFSKLLEYIRDQFKLIKVPLDIVQVLPSPPSKVLTLAMIQAVDTVMVTGSQNNVRQAYSSGIPAIGVGTGNVTTIIDETADIAAAAHKIKLSKTFDNATSCSSENNAVCVGENYKNFLKNLENENGYLLSLDESRTLHNNLWCEGKLNTQYIAKKATKIAELCGIKVPSQTQFLIVEMDNIASDNLFTRERISPILSLYKAKNFEIAKKMAEQLLTIQGAGHSVGIHTTKDERAVELGCSLPTCRVIVNQAHCFATGGAFNNGLPFSLSMGCGSWGGNSIDENLHYKHYLNITKIVREIPNNEPTLDSILGQYKKKYGTE